MSMTGPPVDGSPVMLPQPAQLYDVAVTALVASFSFSDDPEAGFNAKLAKIAARSGISTSA